MKSMKAIDGKELNTAKRGNIAREFNEFKDVLFNEKIIRHKMRRIQSKKNKLGTYEIDKISLSCFGDKILMEFISWLIFIKIVSQTVKRLKKNCHKKDCNDWKDCDNWKRLLWLKKIVTIEKGLW